MPTSARPSTWHILGPPNCSFLSHLLSFPVRWDPAFSEPAATHANVSWALLLCKHWTEDFMCLILFDCVKTLWSKYHYHLHLIDKKTKAQTGSGMTLSGSHGCTWLPVTLWG